MTTTTPDMTLVLPDVSITAGPQWATLLNAAFTRIDAHDHSPGNGVKITPSGLNISADLTFNSNNATDLRTVRLFPNNTFTPAASDRNCLYALGGELYYIDASGNNVQLTLNGTVDVANAITALSIKDSGFFVQYFGDTTRQFRFNASAIPTGTTRILSVPDSGANDTLVTQAATQTLTNKTLTSPVIATPSITTAANIAAVTAPIAPAAGTANIYVSSVDGQLHLQNSAGVDTAIGAGSSAGKNYLQSYYGFTLSPLTGAATSLTSTGNRTTNQTVFGTSTASAATLITYNTASPLRAPGDLQITFPAAGSGAFVETPMFTLDSIDVNTPTQFISFESSLLTVGAVPGDVTVVVVQYDASGNYVGTINPSITSIPTQYYKFKAAFNPTTTSTAKYSLRFVVNTASARTIDVQSIVVGPQFATNTAAVGAWQAYTPSFTGFGTVTGLNAVYRRVGDTMEVEANFTTGTNTAVLTSISLPTGLTIDSSKTTASNTTSSPGQQVGYLVQEGGANRLFQAVTATATSTSLVYFSVNVGGTTLLTPATGSNMGSTATASINFKVPISQWTTSVTLAGNANIEYAYNSSGLTTAGASDTTAFAYGAQGALIGSIASTTTTTSNTTMRVRFQTTIQPTDRLITQISADGVVWVPAPDRGLTPTRQSTASFGVGISAVNSTDVDVFFGNAGSLAGGASYGAAGTAWSAFFNTYRWRVAKYSAVGLAELAPATTTSQGSISRESNWTPYTPTLTGFGTAAGVVGSYKVLGDTLYCRVAFTTGTTTASIGQVTIPTGFTINSTNLPISNTTSNGGCVVGLIHINVAGTAYNSTMVTAPLTSTSSVYLGGRLNGSGTVGSLTPAPGTNLPNTTLTYLNFEVPIV